MRDSGSVGARQCSSRSVEVGCSLPWPAPQLGGSEDACSTPWARLLCPAVDSVRVVGPARLVGPVQPHRGSSSRAAPSRLRKPQSRASPATKKSRLFCSKFANILRNNFARGAQAKPAKKTRKKQCSLNTPTRYSAGVTGGTWFTRVQY